MIKFKRTEKEGIFYRKTILWLVELENSEVKLIWGSGNILEIRKKFDKKGGI